MNLNRLSAATLVVATGAAFGTLLAVDPLDAHAATPTRVTDSAFSARRVPATECVRLDLPEPRTWIGGLIQARNVNLLVSRGWTSTPTDNIEALYSPACNVVL